MKDTNQCNWPRANPGLCAVILFAVVAACPGCARYKPQPLDPLAVQQKLQQVSLANLAQEYDAVKGTETAQNISASVSEGLGPDEAGLAALVLNPGLKSKRLESGIAAGQLVTAGLYPNPSFDNNPLLGSMHPRHQKSIDSSVTVEVLRWQERAANIQTKQANIEAVHYEMLNEEWKTVSDARAAWWNAVASQERLRLNQDEIALSARLLDSVKARIRHGAGTALDANLAELQHLRLQMETQKLETDAESARRTLRQAIGLPYDSELKLRIPPGLNKNAGPLAHTAHTWKLPELISSLPESATMKAVEWRYNVSEGELRAAIARQYPSLRLGPSGTFDFNGNIWSSLLGFAASTEIPLFNRNQGEIKEKQAARDLAHADYDARLQTVQAAVAEAAAQVDSIEQRLAFQERELLPKGQESIALTEKAYKAGEIAGSELLLARSLFIETERSYLELLISYRQALEALEAVLGRRLEDIPGSEAKQ